MRAHKAREAYPLFGEDKRDERYSEKKKNKRAVMVRLNQFGINGGGGGGGNDDDDGETARVLTNLALAIGLAYLSLTGQLGWLFDAIVSIGVLSLSLSN